MIELLLRIEDLCAELPIAILIGIGILTLIIGFFIWLGGARYIGFLTALLGAAFGAFLGLALSKWFNLHSGVAFISSAVLAIVAYFIRNIVIISLAILGKDSNIDGIKLDKNGNLLVADFNGRIFRITPEGEKTEILNRTAVKQYTADFEYIKEKNLMVVPSLWDNRLTLYEFE